MNTTFGAIVMILAVVQASSPSKTIRTGANAAHFSAKDIDHFEKLAGGKPWLIDMPIGQIGEGAALYLPTDKTAKDVRRGTVVLIWFGNVAQTRRYAQVAIDGRAFDDIKNSDDTNMPFAVVDDASFSDAELASIVRFIRSKPTSPITNTIGRSGPVHGDLAISSIMRVTEPFRNEKVGQIKVTIREGDLRKQDVLIEKTGDTWAVVSALSSVA